MTWKSTAVNLMMAQSCLIVGVPAQSPFLNLLVQLIVAAQ
uniref:Uncharacterized protein n=1 Tax=Rhizophora mucronata TaxID=61149 RepID=A0A2P2NXY2_RHIMU